jgi:hypothetical protein
MLLDELLQIQSDTKMELITDHEVRLIRDWWGRDETTTVLREMERLSQLGLPGKSEEK